MNNTETEIYRILREEKNWDLDDLSLNEIHATLYQYFGVLVLVDFIYECDTTPFFYKIYKFKDLITREPERVPVEAARYDEDGTEMIDIVGYRQWKRSYKDFNNYKDAFEEGLLEAVKMIDKQEIKNE